MEKSAVSVEAADAETKTLSNFVPPPLKGEGDRGRGFLRASGYSD